MTASYFILNIFTFEVEYLDLKVYGIRVDVAAF